MTKLNDPSFWATPGAPDDWKGLLSYIKPRTAGELHELFDARPPCPPDMNDTPSPVERSQQTLLEQLRITKNEFVELALTQPDLWNPDELDYLHLAAEEGSTDEHLEELAQVYFSGERQSKKPPPKQHVPVPPKLDMSLEEMPDLPRTTTIPDLEVLGGTESVDRWWEKQKR